MKDEYCSYCGALHDTVGYPKQCINCENMTWSNPLPVAVCVQPVIDTNSRTGKVGLLIAQRAIEPHVGWWALIGGHMENGETFEEAAAREFREELGIEMSDNPKITRSYANGKGHVLVAVEAEPLRLPAIKHKIKLCHENSAWGVMWFENSIDLCFPIHQWIAHEWFNR